MASAPPPKAAKLGASHTPHSPGQGVCAPAPSRDRSRKRNLGLSDSDVLRRDIDACAKAADVDGALAAFQRARTSNISLHHHSFNVLLHLCAGGNQPDGPSRRIFPVHADEIFEYMKAKGVAPIEMTYTALARAAASSGNPDRARQLVREMRENGLTPRLRTFTPALTAYCDVHDIDNALAVEADIRSAGLIPSDIEYAALLRCMSTMSEKPQCAWDLLRRIKADIRMASPSLLEAIRSWFDSVKNDWAVGETMVNVEGAHVTDPRIKLQQVDLTNEEVTELADAIAKLARAREKEDDFENFIAWCKEHGPFGTIVDGANVGMYNQSFDAGQFDFQQVERLMAKLREERGHGVRPVLLVLHKRRVRYGPARTPAASQLIKQWEMSNELYTTPDGSNDDWYWLYAAVNAGPGGVLITNDELRDHVFQMLPSPQLFYKWKECHQARFDITSSCVEIQRPSPFTVCIQEASDGSWWMFPNAEGEGWLCAHKKKKSLS